jgi:hypothetical protein
MIGMLGKIPQNLTIVLFPIPFFSKNTLQYFKSLELAKSVVKFLKKLTNKKISKGANQPKKKKT